MDILRFAHHFFHFESRAWERVEALSLPPEELARRLFAEPLLPRRKLREREPRSFEEAQRLHEENLERERSYGVRALREGDPDYPEALRQLAPERRPALTYLRGAAVPPETQLIGIVGTRAPSEGGREAARSFASYFSAIGIRVASGLARGIDTLAHERSAALGTVAVLGAGVGTVYPEENQPLADRILQQGGTLLSPFPLDQVPLPQNFPDRNELIAALCAGVLVVEGAVKSGASITGRQALALGKTVVVLSQDFRSEFGRGAIRLQQAGAELVTCEEEAVEAIFRRFGGFGSALPAAPGRSAQRSFTFREFQKASGRGVPEAAALLEEGILQGKIERAGLRYRLR
jgi:DNA protecting protein DprA